MKYFCFCSTIALASALVTPVMAQVGATPSNATSPPATGAPPVAQAPNPQTSTAGPSSTTEVRLPEVIVTATRREVNLQNVPVAVSAITAAGLANRGVFETTDLNRSLPNLQVSSPYGTSQPNFTIRGVGVGTEFNANAASPIGVYVDEVYQTFRSSHGEQLFDLDRIEVVRGPQGTLYGRNTTGGAINFITHQPSLQGDNGYITAGYGDYNRRDVEAAYEFTPIRDVLGIRISGTYVKSDSYLVNVLNNGIPSAGGPENYGLRAIVRWRPTQQLDVTFKAYAASSDGGIEDPITSGPSTTSDQINFGHSALGGLYGIGLNSFLPPETYSRSANGLNDQQVQVNTGGQNRNQSKGIVLTAKYTVNSSLSLTSITDYDSGLYSQNPNTDCDGTPYDFCEIGYESGFHAFNQDLRANFSYGRFNLITGAYFGDDSIETHNSPNFFGFLSTLRSDLGLPPTYFNPAGALNPTGIPTGINATQDFQQQRTSAAVYAEGTYKITDTLKLTLGARYTWDRDNYINALSTYYDDAGNPRLVTVSNYTVNGAPAAYLIGVSPGTYSGLQEHGHSSQPTGRAILDWTPYQHILLYVSYSRGYRAGTFNGLAYAEAPQIYFVKPENVDAYETGFKSRFLDDRAQLNGSFFYYNYQNQQGEVVDSTATANLVSLNGKEQGLELEALFAATRDLRLNASLGLLHSAYDHSPCPTAAITTFPPQVGNCVSTGAGNVDVGGNPFPYAADVSLNFGADWDFLRIGDGKFTIHGDGSYTSRFYYDSFGKYDYVNGAVDSRNLALGVFHEGSSPFWLGNARLTYTLHNTTAAAYVKNIFDKTYYPFGINLESLFGVDYRVRADPRTFGFDVTQRF